VNRTEGFHACQVMVLYMLLLLVRSQRLKLFVCHCEERMMQKCGAMNAT
jgi:hypothetical protein